MTFYGQSLSNIEEQPSIENMKSSSNDVSQRIAEVSKDFSAKVTMFDAEK